MSNIQGSFIDQFGAEVKQAYQRAAKLRGTVRSRTGVIGATSAFQKLDALNIATATFTKARGADMPIASGLHSQVVATLADYYQAEAITKLDELKTNVDLRREHVLRLGKGFGRLYDSIIIAALDTTTNATPTTTGGLTVAKVLEAKEIMDGNDVDPEDRYMAVSAKALSDALTEDKLTSSDYQTLKALVQGDIGTAYGFKWIMHTGLPVATSQRTCFAYHKDAVGIALGRDIEVSVGEVFEKYEVWVRAVLSMGAVMVEDAGVVEINVDES